MTLQHIYYNRMLEDKNDTKNEKLNISFMIKIWMK